MEYPELRPVVQAIREAIPVERIYLFGSRARGDARPDSDYDLLVAVPEGYATFRNLRQIYRAVSGGLDLDILLITEKDLERFRHNQSTIYPQALREGRVLLEAA